MSIIIYRIQDRHGRGPWKPGFSDKWVEYRPDCENLVPWSLQFGDILSKELRGFNFGCGCGSVQQLKRWFIPKEYETLLKHGYQAVQMEVHKIIAESDIQLVFSRLKPLRWDVMPFELYSVNNLAVASNSESSKHPECP